MRTRTTRSFFKSARRAECVALRLVFFLLFTFIGWPSAAQDDIALFRLTDVSGDFSVRYLLDSWRNDNGTAPDTRTSAPTWEEELRIRTQSYIYHPAFLEMDIGGGPLLVQYGYETEQGTNDGNEVLFNFDAALNFLDRKAYPFTLYYDRDHSEITTGLSGRFLAESDEYGARGMLRPPIAPAQVFWDVGHWQSDGSGFGTVLDEDLDRAEIRSTLSYRGDDSIGVWANWINRNSKSGSPGLPIQSSEITTSQLNLTGSNKFGSSRSILLRQTFNMLRTETEVQDATQDDVLSYTGLLNWTASERTRLFSDLRYNDLDRSNSWSRFAEFGLGFNQDWREDIELTGESRVSRDEAPGFQRDQYGGRASATYRRGLSFGNFAGSAALGLNRTDQDSDTDSVQVERESHVLVGTVPVPLDRDFVITDTVIVTNVPETQTFIEDLDYRLVTIGATTTIERIVTGNIVDGQEVLVSYEYRSGGTVEYDTLQQSLYASLGLSQWISLDFSYLDFSNNVVSGVATTPLNDTTVIEFGGTVDYPIWAGWTIGGEARYTDRDEDISPSVGQRYSAYVATARYWNTVARLRAVRSMVDNKRSPEDSDSVSYTLGIVSRLARRLTLGYDFEYREDDGGTVDFEQWRHSGRLDWSYRQLRFSLRAEYADTTQGDTGRENTRVVGELRRTF